MGRMLVDHMTVAEGVQAVLGGTPTDTVADRLGLSPEDLDDAVSTYRTAGLTALQQRADSAWYEVRVQFRDWTATENAGATVLGPALDQLIFQGSAVNWWFLRKYPCWRLRLLSADTAAVNSTLDGLVDDRVIQRWWPTVYEPETAAFGGPATMELVHDLFCADTVGALAYLREGSSEIGRRELSILLLNATMRAAGLDAFEAGDVYHRVSQLRPPPANTDGGRVAKLTDQLRGLVLPDIRGSELFAPGGSAERAATWLEELSCHAARLGHAAAQGRLYRGLRAVLTHVVIFHWNRLGLSATTQGVLAHAAHNALLPRS
ncbi:hypothetical protein D5S17_14630 [Pseudonocardiaceae bacterium YIM PH 21723]|nr:hypothetical protein D5S17_14630 [Pseudonocardiaceae bacterium YIM PH 21723]